VRSTGFLVNAEKSTLAKQEDLCRRGSKSMAGVYDWPVPRLLLFLSTPIRPATTSFGMRLSLLMRTHTGTPIVKEAIHFSHFTSVDLTSSKQL